MFAGHGDKSWFDVSFSDGLANQLPTITLACQLGTELGWFTNLPDGAWLGEAQDATFTKV